MKVTLSCSRIRKIARQMFRGHWAGAFLAVFICAVLVNGPGYIVYYLSGSRTASTIVELYTVFVTGPLTLGLSNYFLNVFRGTAELGMGSLTERGPYLLSGVALYVTEMILVIMWSFLLVVPGIIAAIRYSQAFYVLADEPDMNPFDCIRQSNRLMLGNKGKYLLLLLSYLPWLILASIPAGIVRSNLVGSAAVYDVAGLEALLSRLSAASMHPAVILLSVLTLFVQVYVMAGTVCFYDLANGSLVVEHGDVTYEGYIADSVDRYEITGFESKYKDQQEDRDETQGLH
ncbi:MAG: DUF975 family protein [Clostridia bacterium]|nr:DUF975 family protein [Clostridia bacterium]